MTTTREAATQLDTDEQTITALVDQIADDPDLYDTTTNTITRTGMDILRDQMAASGDNASDAKGADLLAELEAATAAHATAEENADLTRERRDGLIRALAKHGHPRTDIAQRAGISRERLYQII